MSVSRTRSGNAYSVWGDLAVCYVCGAEIRVTTDDVVCTACDIRTPLSQGWLNISRDPLPEDTPLGGNQMKVPGKPETIKHYESKFSGLFKRAGLPPVGLRILELGAGHGATTFGVLKAFNPQLHIVTEPFPSLLPPLRERLDDWGAPAPRGLVAALDGNSEIALKPRSVNLILSHGVLHHVLDYEGCVRRCAELCDSPGAIFFSEPMKEGYAFVVTVLRCLEELVARGATAPVSDRSKLAISRAAKKLGDRVERSDDREFLASLGAADKHLFSVSKMEALASALGYQFFIDRRPVECFGFVLGILNRRGVAAADLEALKPSVRKLIPKNLQDVYLSEPRGLMCFYRT